MWHFDGDQWQEIVLGKANGGPVQDYYYLYDVFGTSSRDVWAVGKTSPSASDTSIGLVVHFDGAIWSSVTLGPNLYHLGGDVNQIFACGESQIFRLNGLAGTEDSIDLVLPESTRTYLSCITRSGSANPFATVRENNRSAYNRYYLLSRDTNYWKTVDTTLTPTDYLWLSPSNALFSTGGSSIRKWSGTEWTTVFQSQIAQYAQIFGTSDRNIIAIGGPTTILNFNGIDWFEMLDFRNKVSSIEQGWTDGKEVFLLATAQDQTQVIIHGK